MRFVVLATIGVLLTTLWPRPGFSQYRPSGRQRPRTTAPWPATKAPRQSNTPGPRPPQAVPRAVDREVEGWLSQAERAVEKGDIGTAVGLADRHSESAGESFARLSRTARIYERAAINGPSRDPSLYQKAEALWLAWVQSCQKADSDAATAVDHLVRLWGLRGVLPERTSALRRKLGQDAEEPIQLLWLASAEARLGHHQAAMAHLQSWVTREPNNVLALTRLEQLAVQSGDLPSALQWAERRFAHSSAQTTLHATLVDYALRTGNLPLAQRYAERWASALPASPLPLAELAKIADRLGNRGLARINWERACQLDPSRFDLRLELALCKQRSGSYAEAEGDWLTILRDDSDPMRLSTAFLALGTQGGHKTRGLEIEDALRHTSRQSSLLPQLREWRVTVYERLLAERPTVESAKARVPRAQRALAELLIDERGAIQSRVLELLAEHPDLQTTQSLLDFARRNFDTEPGEKALLLLLRKKDPSIARSLRNWFDDSRLEFSEAPQAFLVLRGFCLDPSNDNPKRLETLLERGSPSMRALSALALAAQNRRDAATSLVRQLKSPLTPALVRAAVLLSLHDVAPDTLVPTLIPSDAATSIERLSALSTLGAIKSPERTTLAAKLLAREALSPASGRAWLRSFGTPLLTIRRGIEDPNRFRSPENLILALCDGQADASAEWMQYQRLRDSLRGEFAKRLNRDPEYARALTYELYPRPGRAALAQLMPSQQGLPANLRSEVERAQARFLGELQETLSPYRDAIDPDLRRNVLGLAALSGRDPSALVAALSDPSTSVREAALGWPLTAGNDVVFQAVLTRLKRDPDPLLRSRAASRLASMRPLAPSRPLEDALLEASRNDSSKPVRFSALSALCAAFAVVCKRELSYAIPNEPDPEARQALRHLLESTP